MHPFNQNPSPTLHPQLRPNSKKRHTFKRLQFHCQYMRQCKYLLSSISAEPSISGVSLDIQVVELGWWLEGSSYCSKDANCTPVLSPGGRQGFRCQCKQGFQGDGYHAGIGCHKGSVAGAFFIISLGVVCCFIRRRSYSKTRNRTKHRLSEATGISIPIYPYKEIEKATNGFSEKQRLGTGAYGTVYQGKLHNNDLWVAIKRIKQRDTDSIEQVVNEIKLLSSVSHPNLVRLLGCSIEHGEQILVYEFMPNGTLCQHLQRERGDGLAWPVRLTIATETAQAIAHLHSAINPPIYHRDIKSSNILLDYNFKSKVADFGLSRLDEIIDPFLEPHSDAWTFCSVHKVAELAFRCLAFHRDMRPSMMEVAAELEQIRMSRWASSEEITCTASSEPSPCSSFSNISEKPLSFSVKKGGIESRGGFFLLHTEANNVDIIDGLKENSPVSVQDPWLSEQSSPSSNSLLSNVHCSATVFSLHHGSLSSSELQVFDDAQ
ncbi:hypothetical protein Patl1_09067 [Pistacia atlantica]|uniref:Uncharacterized protein n=1 Tax=Pistacia atlantica TaxID=434234 RepID=A0ACC1AGC2_9ROSI|nr:hypothetical protein Patl1_09067 [Pistacia atlantica]